MKEISIIAATFYGNRGAEAMLSTTMAEINNRYEGSVKFNVFSYYPSQDAKLVSNTDVMIYSSKPVYLVLVLLPCAFLYRLLVILQLKAITGFLPQSVRALSRSKLLICLAGVSFVAGRNKFLPFNIATILPAMLLGVPVIKFAQALGPFGGILNRLAARKFLKNCEQIFTRGDLTHAYLQELLGSNLNYERADDIAFLFKTEYCLSLTDQVIEKELVKLKRLRADGRLVVGVCPSIVVAKHAHANGWDYVQSIANLINDLVRKGYVVALYPNATRGDDMDKMHNNDLPLLNDIRNKLSSVTKDKLLKFSGSLNAAQIYQIISLCDTHLVSRFHAMVAALSLGIPVLVIGWSHKYLEVMKRFGQADMVIDQRKGNHNSILKLLDHLIDNRLKISETIENSLIEVQKLSQRQIDFAIKLLEKN